MTESSISDAQKAQIEKLKAAGNAFHVEGKYRKAYSKYSEAIKVDSTNAILYANRAASALSMKECVTTSIRYDRIDLSRLTVKTPGILTLGQTQSRLSTLIPRTQRHGFVSEKLFK